MFTKIRKTAIVLAAGSMFALTTNHAEAGHFGDKFRAAASQFKQSAHQFQQQGGYRQTFKNAISQRLNQPSQNGQPSKLQTAQTFFDLPDVQIPIPNFPVPGSPAPLPFPRPQPQLTTTDFFAQGISWGVQWTW